MYTASKLPGRAPTDVDDAPAPSSNDGDDDDRIEKKNASVVALGAKSRNLVKVKQEAGRNLKE